MEQNITTHTFREDDTWETIDTLWYSPFFYWQKNGLRVTPVVPLRIVTAFGNQVDESDEGWINTGGPSAMFLQRIQARGRRGETIRVETGDELSDETFAELSAADRAAEAAESARRAD